VTDERGTVNPAGLLCQRAGYHGAKQSVRLFMLPKLQHCFGGNGPGLFGHIGALAQSAVPERHLGIAMQQWVEQARAPESVIGSPGFDLMSAAALDKPQPWHCAWPKQSELKAEADPDKAENYNFRLPQRR
jgi:Tannase and feruloyl esterase